MNERATDSDGYATELATRSAKSWHCDAGKAFASTFAGKQAMGKAVLQRQQQHPSHCHVDLASCFWMIPMYYYSSVYHHLYPSSIVFSEWYLQYPLNNYDNSTFFFVYNFFLLCSIEY